jgi:hypothetical protein
MAPSNKNTSNKEAPATRKKARMDAGEGEDEVAVEADHRETIESLTVVKEEKGKRTPNFLSKEDELLCKAWVYAAEDPIKGCNQKGFEFWTHVQESYGLLQAKEPPPADAAGTPRGWMQLKTRFLRHIQPTVNSFNRHYRWAYTNLPSGTPRTFENFMALAKKLYKEEFGTEFKFDLCIPILHETPKFNPFAVSPAIDVDSVSGNSKNDNGTVNMIIAAGASSSIIERPIGCKAAKAQRKVVEGNQKEITLMREEIASLRDSLTETLERRLEVKELAELAKMYRQDGDLQLARETTKQMRQLIERNSVKRKKNWCSTTTSTSTSSTASSTPSSAAAPRPPAVVVGGWGTPTTSTVASLSQNLLLEEEDDEDEDDEETIVLGLGKEVLPCPVEEEEENKEETTTQEVPTQAIDAILQEAGLPKVNSTNKERKKSLKNLQMQILSKNTLAKPLSLRESYLPEQQKLPPY